MENKCKCGSLDFFIEKQGNNTGLYCSMCGKWQKWMNKDDIRLFEHNHKTKKKNEKRQTWGDKIRSMSDEELAEFISSLIKNSHEYLTGEGNWLQWLQSEAE